LQRKRATVHLPRLAGSGSRCVETATTEVCMETMRKGSKGDHVKQMQQYLVKLGYDVQPDGVFGDATEKAVKHLQTSFGYTVDGVVGDGTHKLIHQQLALNWNMRTAKESPATHR
jgi:peptidoglycan hydrolase-like protein with peptidoglycan-binding domain